MNYKKKHTFVPSIPKMFAEAEIARKESMSTPSPPLNMPVVERRESVSQQGPSVGVVFRKINK